MIIYQHRKWDQQQKQEEPIVILNNDDLIREQLNELSPLLNIQNLKCSLSQKEGQNLDMSIDMIPISKQKRKFQQDQGKELQRNILPLTLKLQVFPECSTDILADKKREKETDEQKKLKQQSRNYKDQTLFYLMIEQETFLPTQQNNENSEAINLSTLLTNRNSLKSNLKIDKPTIKLSIQKHNSQKKEHKQISAQIDQIDNGKNFSHKEQDFKALTHGISQGEYAPINGQELHQVNFSSYIYAFIQLIRSYGYGIRHLGKIYKDLQINKGPKFILTLIGVQLYARVIKSRILEQCLCNRKNYEAIIIENINEYFNSSNQSTHKFNSIKHKVDQRYGTKLTLFDQISYRLLILQRSLQLLNIRIKSLKYKQIKFSEPIIKKNFGSQEQYGIESVPKLRAYEFSSLPIIHFAKESSMWNDTLRGIKSIRTLFKTQMKRVGHVRPYFRILIAESAIGCGRFDLAEKWLYQNKADFQNSPGQIYFLITLMKAAFSKQDIVEGNRNFVKIQEVINLFWKGHHPIIITVNKLLSKYFQKIFEGILDSQNMALRPLFSALLFSQDIYKINSLHSVAIMFRICKLQVDNLRLRKLIQIQNNNQVQNQELLSRFMDHHKQNENQIYFQLKEIVNSLEIVSQICLNQQRSKRANFLHSKAEILISICKLQIGQQQQMKNSAERLQESLQNLRAQRQIQMRNYEKGQFEEINQRKYRKKIIKCAYVRFLGLLKIRDLQTAKDQAERIFLLLIEDELKQNKKIAKTTTNTSSSSSSSLAKVQTPQNLGQQVVVVQQKVYVINYSYKLKQRFLLAALCLSLKFSMTLLQEHQKQQFGIDDQNSLGHSILTDQYFFSKFAFNYQTIQRGSRITLERIYRNAASQSFNKGLNLIDFILEEHILKIDEKVFELMRVFRIKSI